MLSITRHKRLFLLKLAREIERLFSLMELIASIVPSRPESVEELNKQVEDRIKTACPKVQWVANYAVLGPYDYWIFSRLQIWGSLPVKCG